MEKDRLGLIDYQNMATDQPRGGAAQPAKTFVDEILEEIAAIHRKKNNDYSGGGEQHENFMRAAILAEWFNDPMDKVFAVLFGIKLARLANLYGDGKTRPVVNNESVSDSHLDFDTYAVIWHVMRQRFGSFEEMVCHYYERRKNLR